MAAYTSRLVITQRKGAHRSAQLHGFDDLIHFGIHGGIQDFYETKYGRSIEGPPYPATLDFIVAGVAG